LLDQLNYTTNWRVRKLLHHLGVESVTDLNSEDLRIRYRKGEFGGKIGPVVRWLLRSRVLSGSVKWAGLQYIRLTEWGSEMLVLPGARNACK
jgi:hypothetical protein